MLKHGSRYANPLTLATGEFIRSLVEVWLEFNAA
jgi:hypothetical protein